MMVRSALFVVLLLGLSLAVDAEAQGAVKSKVETTAATLSSNAASLTSTVDTAAASIKSTAASLKSNAAEVLKLKRDGGWSQWSSWGGCSSNCGTGTQSKTRTCDNPAPAHGGESCSGLSTAVQQCNTNPCPVDGGWGPWGSFSECTKTCGGGQQARKRVCNLPVPQHGGADCDGADVEDATCNHHPCPIDGTWQDWGAFSTCSATCGGGTRTRTRTCAGTLWGGLPCVGDTTQTEPCNQHQCCDAGTIVTTDGFCASCEAGTYQDEKDQAECKSCGPGRHQPAKGQSSCLLCAAGTYHKNGGAAHCLECLAGTYSEGLGNFGCLSCAVGRYASGTKSTSCSSCEPDTFADTPGAVKCMVCNYHCPSGKFKPSCGNSLADEGSLSSALTSKPGVCRDCDPGTFKSTAGTAKCTPHRAPCADSEWESVNPTATVNRECKPHDKCNKFEFEARAATTTAPRICKAIYHCKSDEYETRKPGPRNDRECTATTTCAAGKYQKVAPTATTDRVCEQCPVGTHKGHAGNAPACIACPANYVARSNGLSCKPVQCSHMTCQHEAHSCNYGKSSATLRAFIGQYRHVTSNCDGIGSGGYQSIRVSHGGNLCNRHNPLQPTVRPKCTEEELKMDEVPCANGHRCGMGVVTGNKDQCECAPLQPIDYVQAP